MELIPFTFNPWWGCTRVSPGRDHCYAERIDQRAGGGHWGKGASRRTFGEKYWARPLQWDAAAARLGERARVRCASMADVFDAEAPESALERLWALIRRTSHLDWLVLTRRPARIERGLPPDWDGGYDNVCHRLDGRLWEQLPSRGQRIQADPPGPGRHPVDA